MKLLIIASLSEHQEIIHDLLAKAEVPVFSATEALGYKNQQAVNLMDNWFSTGTAHFDSRITYAFTSGELADKVLNMVKAFNAENPNGFPLRAYIMPVEAASY